MELTAREIINAAYEFYTHLETTLPPDIPIAYRRQITRRAAALAGLNATDAADSMDTAKAEVESNSSIPISWGDILFVARSQFRRTAANALAAQIVVKPSGLWDAYFSDRYKKLLKKVDLIGRMIDDEEEYE